MVFIFTLPKDAENPPSRAVVEELKAIDAASKGSFPFGVTGFVGAPDVGDGVPALNAIGDRVFEEALAGESVFAAGDVFFGGQDPCYTHAFVVAAGGNQTRPRIKERAKAIPVAGSAGWSGDYVVHGGDDVLNAIHIAGVSWRCGRCLWSVRRRESLLVRVCAATIVVVPPPAIKHNNNRNLAMRNNVAADCAQGQTSVIGCMRL
jgi:hypothetical protein